MGDLFTNPVRHPEDTGIAYIRRTMTLAQLATPEDATYGMPIGALEAGTQPLYCHVYVETLFNAGTTNVLEVGTVDDTDGFATSAGVIAGTAGFKGNLTGALTGIPLAADKVVYVKYSPTGTTATTGKVVVTLTFAVKRDTVGIPWPGN